MYIHDICIYMVYMIDRYIYMYIIFQFLKNIFTPAFIFDIKEGSCGEGI